MKLEEWVIGMKVLKKIDIQKQSWDIGYQSGTDVVIYS